MFPTLRDELKEAGRREELRAMIVDLATPQCGAPDEAVRASLEKIEDLARLRTICRTAVTARTWAELLQSKEPPPGDLPTARTWPLCSIGAAQAVRIAPIALPPSATGCGRPMRL